METEIKLKIFPIILLKIERQMMLIKVSFYKKTGKWYAEDVIEFDDNTQLFDVDVEKIMLLQTVLSKTRTTEFLIHIDLLESEQERLPDKFFKAILNT
jgi:hypothetical protein